MKGGVMSAKSRMLNVKVTPELFDLIAEACETAGVRRSAWMRDVLEGGARQELQVRNASKTRLDIQHLAPQQPVQRLDIQNTRQVVTGG